MKEVSMYQTPREEVFDDYQKAVAYLRDQSIKEYGVVFETVDGMRFRDNDKATAHEDELVWEAAKELSVAELLREVDSTIHTVIRGTVAKRIANETAKKELCAIAKRIANDTAKEEACEQLQSI